MNLKPALALLLLLAVATASARGRKPLAPVLFGSEFTFARPDLNRKPSEIDWWAVVSRMRNHLVNDQPDNAKFTAEGSKFTSPNGWTFLLHQDPGVFETSLTPMDVETAKRFAPDVQDAIFASHANEGYFPPLFLGGGHISIDLNVLIQHPRLLRNLIVDFYNHSELFMGVFNYDSNNALPFALFSSDTQESIQAVIQSFDKGDLTVFELLSKLNKIQYNSDDAFLSLWRGSYEGTVRGKHTALSFDSVGTAIGPASRLELRGVRPQASFAVWVKQIELLRGRIEHLNQLDEPIPFRPAVRLLSMVRDQRMGYKISPPVDPQAALAAFHRYLSESGESWEDHREYLWPAWISSGEVEFYERSADFKYVKRRFCAQALVVR